MLADLKQYNYPGNYESYLTLLADRDNLRQWAEDDMSLAIMQGLLTANGQLFEPDGTVTKGEAAVLLMRLYGLLNDVDLTIEPTAYLQTEEAPETPPEKAPDTNVKEPEEEPEQNSFPIWSGVLIGLAGLGVAGGSALAYLKMKKPADPVPPQQESTAQIPVNGYCASCGNAVDANARFCTVCGNPVNTNTSV